MHRDNTGLGSEAINKNACNHGDNWSQTESFHPFYLALTLFLVGINLRPAQSSVAPILDAIRRGVGLSSTAAGVLTMLPVLCFGIFAPLAPRLLNRFRPDQVVLFSLFLLCIALGVRPIFGAPTLFLGTSVSGAAIGVIMVVLPSLIKRDFPRHAPGMMGVYTMAMCLGAALAAGLTVPVQRLAGGSWSSALAIWAIPALIAGVVWLPRVVNRAGKTNGSRDRVGGLYSNPLAWQVAAFLGLQSALAYCVFGWLPSVLIDRGMSALGAGATLSLTIGMQLPTALAGPWLSGLGQNQRRVIFITMALVILAFVECCYGNIEQIWVWASLLGLGLGASFSVALTLIVLRAENPAVAAGLSGMAQGCGYSIAALGPLAFGLLKDMGHGWDFSIGFFVSVGISALFVGLSAGRNRYIRAIASPAG